MHSLTLLLTETPPASTSTLLWALAVVFGTGLAIGVILTLVVALAAKPPRPVPPRLPASSNRKAAR